MKVLVINCGSSSLKYQLFNMEDESVLAKGVVERIGIEGSLLTHKVNDQKYIIKEAITDHKVGIKLVLDALVNENYAVIKDLSEIGAVGHRVVHGGEKYSTSVVIDDSVMKSIEDCVKLAPLHNPPNIIGIKACEELIPGVSQVAVFDTAFHQTMPKESYLYALPYDLYENYGIRRYGFHGTSHKFLTAETAKVMGKKVEDLKIITCHLGNGSSVAAIKGGKSLDTSMGFTPLEGLVMGTRCGDIDPAIVTYIMKTLNLSIAQTEDLLNKQSGMLGVTGISSDFRDIEDKAFAGDETGMLGLRMFANSVKKYIGSYAVEMGGVDAIVFAGGVGENGPEVREMILDGVEFFGFTLDKDANAKTRFGKSGEISTKDSKVKVFVLPTDEELVIARDTNELTAK